MKPADAFHVGYVARVHGLRGELVVRTFDPESEAMEQVAQLWLESKDKRWLQAPLVEAEPSAKGHWRIQLENVRSREVAEDWQSAQVYVSRAELDAPDEGEFFAGDLVGLVARDSDGKSWGLVTEIQTYGPVCNLVIRDGEQELMLPFVEAYVGEVDLERREVVVNPKPFLEADDVPS